MSFKLNLDQIINDLKNTTNQIDATVNNISNSANRLVLQMNKSSDQTHTDSKNQELMLKSAQEIMNIFSNFKLLTDNKEKNKTGDPLAAADTIKTAPTTTAAAGNDNRNGHKDNNQNDFEQYKSTVENRANQIDREVDRLNALRDVVKEILN